MKIFSSIKRKITWLDVLFMAFIVGALLIANGCSTQTIQRESSRFPVFTTVNGHIPVEIDQKFEESPGKLIYSSKIVVRNEKRPSD